MLYDYTKKAATVDERITLAIQDGVKRKDRIQNCVVQPSQFGSTTFIFGLMTENGSSVLISKDLTEEGARKYAVAFNEKRNEWFLKQQKVAAPHPNDLSIRKPIDTSQRTIDDSKPFGIYRYTGEVDEDFSLGNPHRDAKKALISEYLSDVKLYLNFSLTPQQLKSCQDMLKKKGSDVIALDNKWRVYYSGSLYVTNGTEKGDYLLRYTADIATLNTFLYNNTNFAMPHKSRENEGKTKQYKGKGVLLKRIVGSEMGQFGEDQPTMIEVGKNVSFTVYADGHVAVTRFLTTINIPVTQLHATIKVE